MIFLMTLQLLDWGIILAFFLVSLVIGGWVVKTSSKNTKEYFLSGRNMPWWLLGVSMVATTFSADTPNLVTDIVRTNGVSGNWVWWAFLLTGMLTVFVYARLWRRSGIMTDLEFYELRYSGKEARFLRGFRAVYLGFFFNVMIMATVLLAGIKMSHVLLGLNPIQTVLLVSLVTVAYASMGGLRAVILTDFFQFALSMTGMVIAAVFIVNLPEIGGLSNMLAHENVSGKLDFIPSLDDPDIYIPLLLIPLAVQWWSVWYPGSEPGGGGYVAQRMLSAKNENDAIKATLFFNIAHYALRPWPWILIALASMIVFPDLASIKSAFPGLSEDLVKNDLAFPAMLSKLPTGLLGLLIASLLAALMSTLSTHLNWGASYIVKDLIVRFSVNEISEERQVFLGRISTVILMLTAALMALVLSNALQAFNILLQIGAGTGLIFILRWFWWRINAYSEITAMVVSFLVAIYFEILYTGPLLSYQKMLIGIAITTTAWLFVTWRGPSTDIETLKQFYKKIQPSALGWKVVVESIYKEGGTLELDQKSSLGTQIWAMMIGCFMVYFMLFGIGSLIYINMTRGLIFIILALLMLIYLFKLLRSGRLG